MFSVYIVQLQGYPSYYSFNMVFDPNNSKNIHNIIPSQIWFTFLPFSKCTVYIPLPDGVYVLPFSKYTLYIPLPRQQIYTLITHIFSYQTGFTPMSFSNVFNPNPSPSKKKTKKIWYLTTQRHQPRFCLRGVMLLFIYLFIYKWRHRLIFLI